MEEEDEVPSILGQPFLATRRVIIVVEYGELPLRLGNEEVKFTVFNSHEISSPLVSCNCVQTLNISDGTTSSSYPNTKKSCLETLENPKPCKEPVKKWPEKKLLIYNSCFFSIPNELHSKWYGPYIVTKVLPYGVVEVTFG
ncbi:hypothetical protein CR513_13310, partial [Mucuna pruriens]